MENTTGIPLRGPLTHHGRLLAQYWSCGVCRRENHVGLRRCEDCNQPREAAWQKVGKGQDSHMVQPGTYLRLQSGVQVRQKDSTEDNVLDADHVAVVVDVDRMGQRFHLVVVPLVEGAPCTRASAACHLSISGRQDGHDARVAVEDPSGLHRPFSKIGLCGRCESLYQIGDGELLLANKEIEALRHTYLLKSDRLTNLKAEKAIAKNQADYDKVTDLTASMKELDRELTELRRKLLPKQPWCPYCAWSPEDTDHLVAG